MPQNKVECPLFLIRVHWDSSFFLFDLLDRLLERRDERLWVSQVVLGQLEFTHQHTVFVRKDQAVTLFHGDAPYWLIPMLGNLEEPVKRAKGNRLPSAGACPRLLHVRK